MGKKILAINPGSTSTKIAIFDDETLVNETGLNHPVSEMNKFPTTFSQLNFRYEVIMDYLKSINFDINSLDACVGRGGYLHPIIAGTYTSMTCKLH